jgi:hypothetical protein
MSVVDRLKMHADLAVYGQQVVTVGLSDLRALLALVEACIEEQRVMEIAGNVKPGIDADAAWEAYDEAARATHSALAAVTRGE